MKVLIIAGGELRDSGKVRQRIEVMDYDLVIAVDRGYNNAQKLGIAPDIVIGDLDSIDRLELDKFKGEIIRYNPEKDETDLMLTCEYEKNAKSIDILCATGGRLDHFMGNLAVLENLHNKDIYVRIIDEKNIITVLQGKQQYHNLGKYVSVIPITDEIELTCTNLKYQANKLTVKREKLISISNEAISHEFEIEISKGKAYIIQADD